MFGTLFEAIGLYIIPEGLDITLLPMVGSLKIRMPNPIHVGLQSFKLVKPNPNYLSSSNPSKFDWLLNDTCLIRLLCSVLDYM